MSYEKYSNTEIPEFQSGILHKKYDFLWTKSEIVHKNPASPDTPTGMPVAWSNTIPVFPMKN
ncbi:MAG: hypothetical protein J5966_09770, partial [Lachnospiraceae bacterium]|nr:hypothetical protein [Lachnospiraceae bacterium]